MSFRKANTGKVALKVLCYGGYGSGKSYFACTFPKIAAIDSENGIIHYEKTGVQIKDKTYKNILFVENTSDVKVLEDDMQLFLDKDKSVELVETLVIDSETKFYDMLQIASMEAEEKRARRKGGDVDDAAISQRGWGKIKLNTHKFQQMKIDIASMGVNIVSTAQMADLRDKKDFTKVIGDKADTHKTLPYDYDIVLRFYNETDENGVVKYFAEVLKDRTTVTKRGDILESPTYEVWKSYAEVNDLPNLNLHQSKDLESSVDKLSKEDIKVEDLISEIKSIINTLTTDKQKLVLDKCKTESIDLKNITKLDIETLNNLLTYLKGL